MANRYLEGEFAPVHEEYTITDLVTGHTFTKLLDHSDRFVTDN